MRSSRAYDYFFTLDIYTTTFIVANYYSIDLYFEHVYIQLSLHSW